jgi:uroporphyrinogen-III synthase
VVETVTAYRTVEVRPAATSWDGADALLLASGSAARAWTAAFGTSAPALIVAIGPTTAGAAREAGLKVTAVAADHSLDGLVDALVSCVSTGGTRQDRTF